MRNFACRLLAVVALSLVVFTATAQTHYVPHVMIGGRGGVTFSSIDFSPGVEQTMIMGYTFGATFTYAEERHVGLRAELNISQRGWQENFEEYSDRFSYSRSLTYVSLPVMTHIFFGGRKVKCLFNLGPEFGYLIAESVTANFDYKNPTAIPGFPTQNRNNEQLYLDVKNRFDYGITAGVGVEYVINRKNSIQLEARYYFGLGNIYPASKKDVFGASRNQTISVAIAYQFRLK